jgi:hypothetical protein
MDITKPRNSETKQRNNETPERNSETTRFILFLVKGINYIVRRDEIKSLIKLQRHQHIIVSVDKRKISVKTVTSLPNLKNIFMYGYVLLINPL